MSIFQKILGVKYKAEGKYFNDKYNAIIYANQSNCDYKTVFFAYLKPTFDEIFEGQEAQTLAELHREKKIKIVEFWNRGHYEYLIKSL